MRISDHSLRPPRRMHLLPLLGLLALASCGDSDDGPQPDTIPPGAVQDLAASDTSATWVDLAWTAPAEDGASGGPVASFDLRYVRVGSAGEWDDWTEVEGEPAPATPGSRQSARIEGLAPDSLYSMALKSRDDAGLLSPLSNVVTLRTRNDPFPPGPISDLRPLVVRRDSVRLGWTAPAEDGSSGGPVASYDLRVRLRGLDEGVWDRADRIEGEPVPAAPGSAESAWVGGLLPSTLYAFGIKSRDVGGLESGLSNVAFVTTAALPDTIPPAAVSDLRQVDIHSTSVLVRWTATGDDQFEGRASAYDLRYRQGGIGESLWDDATRVDGLAPPQDPGRLEQFEIQGLQADILYGIAMLVYDEAGNASELSNVLEVTPPPPIPLFIDPRGLDGDPTSRVILVADHGDDSVYRLAQDGSKSELARIAGVLSVSSVNSLITYATADGSTPGSGRLWSFGGSTSQPMLLANLDVSPVDLDIDSNGYLLVTGSGMQGRLLRFRPTPGLLEELVTIVDGEPAGIAAGLDGAIYFGVNRSADAWLRRRHSDGTLEDFHPLGEGRICGDLTSDPASGTIWYLDSTAAAVIRVTPEGQADTLAKGLDEPVAIAAGPGPSLYYCNSRGFVVVREVEERPREPRAKRRP